jgi:hypothetical protein
MTALWIGAVTWYWWENVPLVPTRSVNVPVDRLAGMLTPAGELVVIRTRRTGGNITKHGPLEFWSFPEVRKARESLSADDEIVWGPNYLSGEALIRRNGALQLVNAYSGEHLTTLPDLSGVKEFRMVPGRRQVLVQENRDIHLFEFGQLEPRWTVKDFRLRSNVVGGILIAMSYSNQMSNSNQLAPLWKAVGAKAVNVETGQIDLRFDHAGPSREIQLSTDGRWAVVRSMDQKRIWGDKRSVYDATTGTLLWTTPLKPTIDYCWFPSGGEDLCALQTTPHEPGNYLRWRAADGVPLPPPTKAEQREFNRQVTPNGQYAYVDANSSPPRMISSWLNRPTLLPAAWRDRLWSLLHRQRRKVIDHRSERLIGYLPDYERAFVLKENLGFATFISGGRISYYALPPQHNWLWLAVWTLVPPATLWFLSQVWQRRRRLLFRTRTAT